MAWENEREAAEERKRQLARMYMVYLDDAAAWERWDEVAKWAERLVKCLRAPYNPDGPVHFTTSIPRRPAPTRQIDLD